MFKISTLDDLVRNHVQDGDTVFVGGFGQNIPFAIGFEIIRQERRQLTLCRTGADILFDLMIAAGAVKKVVVGWIGNPGIGLNHAFTRAWGDGSVEIEESSNFAILLRLMAGALGIPFIPTRTLHGGDIAGRLASAMPLRCPFTDEPVMVVKALQPDLAIVHAQRADEDGNIQSWGIIGDTIEGVNASRRVIATVEEIVSRDVIRAAPERTIIPSWRISAIAKVQFGAHPSYSQDYYDRDDAFYHSYDKLARDKASLDRWIKDHIRDAGSWEGHLALTSHRRLEALARRAKSTIASG